MLRAGVRRVRRAMRPARPPSSSARPLGKAETTRLLYQMRYQIDLSDIAYWDARCRRARAGSDRIQRGYGSPMRGWLHVG